MRFHNRGAARHKYRAKKVVEDGEKFDSKIELHFKRMLDTHRIPYVMKRKFVLQEKFKYGENSEREIAIVPDFVILSENGVAARPVAIVDTKGITGYSKDKKSGKWTKIVGTREWHLKWKMLKKKLAEMNVIIPLFAPFNKTECQKTIIKLLEISGPR